VALVYFDSSALVKLVVEETGSDLAAELWDACDAALSSRLAYSEVRAALAAAGRNRDLDTRGLLEAHAAWEELWATTRPVELTTDVERRAGELTAKYPLRGADAVHLASALAVGTAEVVVAVWDRQLHAAVTAEQLVVAPATFGP
jgi:predicted nucleic acid-binding protein